MRKVLFWLHLTAGTTAGVVILIMSVTGVLLMYERQILAWADREYRVSSSAAGERLGPEALLERIVAAERTLPVSLTVHSDPMAPSEAVFGRRTAYVDPYSGRVLGDGSKRAREFFRMVTDWHRWLAMNGEQRPIGRTITGVCNLAFLFLVVSGMYIWLPRRRKWAQFRAVLLFRGGVSGRARDFNWHNVIGIWSAVPLFFVVLGGVVISFPWATNLLYRLTGSEPPRAAGLPAGRVAAAPAPARVVSLGGLDRAWQATVAKVPSWQTITLRPSAPEQMAFLFVVAEAHRGRPDKRSTVTIDRATGEVMEHETFASYNTARRWRMWLRFIHTGEALGIFGQTVAGLVSAGAAMLVWTGIALCWRRFRGWRAGRRLKQAPAAVASPAMMDNRSLTRL